MVVLFDTQASSQQEVVIPVTVKFLRRTSTQPPLYFIWFVDFVPTNFSVNGESIL